MQIPVFRGPSYVDHTLNPKCSEAYRSHMSVHECFLGFILPNGAEFSGVVLRMVLICYYPIKP